MAGKGKKVFIVGPGFIGWNIIDLLVAQSYSVTGLVRRQEHADGIKSSGAVPILGDLDDGALIKNVTGESDIVIHTATADHLPSAQAILEGVKERAERGLETVYIHTSGTSVLDDRVDGMVKSERVYSDVTRDGVDSVPDDAPHRVIDTAIVKVQRELRVKAKIAIMIPPLIYGFNPRHGRLTIQIPTLTRFALKHGYAPHMGAGAAVESNIHVLDLARAYMVLLEHMLGTPAGELLENPYWFCEGTGDGEPSWRDVAEVIGRALYEKGKVKSPEPRTVPEEDYKDLFGKFTGAVLGLNSRSRAERLRALGWAPREKSWKESFLEDELPEILKEEGADFAGYKGLAAS